MRPAAPREYPLVIINLETGEGIDTLVFPEQIEHVARANWRAQEVTGGTKPLVGVNTEPEVLSFPSAWLVASDARESLTPRIRQVKSLTKRAAGSGTPPPLLVSWGDEEVRCVLEEAAVTQNYSDGEGRPLRAELRLSFVELQPERQPAPAKPPRENEQSLFTF